MIDQRLIGSWKSDTRRTMRDLRKLRGMRETTLEMLRKKIYGRLIHRWTRTKFCTAFEDDADWDEVRYRVVAKDDWTVALWISADANSWIEDKDHILHVHFDGPDYYWIPVVMGPGLTREWFRRMDATRRMRKK